MRRLSRASVRREQGRYLAEGVRLVSEAHLSGQAAEIILYDSHALRRSDVGCALLGAIPGWARQSYEVATHVLGAAAQTETPAGVLAVLCQPQPPPLGSRVQDAFGLVLDGLADPGNAGTILRTADAFGVGYAITTPGSVDLFAPKVVRAGMGAHFHLPLYEHVSWERIAADLTDVTFMVADSAGGEPLQRMKWPDAACIVIGSEATGPSPQALALGGIRLRIPLRPEVESLNAAAAAAILLYAGPGSRGIGGTSVTDDGLRRTRK